ncbi:MAG: PTS system N-acetylglucosamine-specific IIC component, partial [Psychromonas sp.]|uniref:glucose PTS transporter subunit EIIB n=1 Tax=Psychromonas sp. TaxID=1884585 RepID=UPI0039E57459
GLSVFFAASMQWMAGFGFSAGFVDMVLSSQNPLAVKWYMLIDQGIAFFAIYYFVFLALIKGLNLKTPGREDEQENGSKTTASVDAGELATQYVTALGGSDNLEVIDACITRLRLTLKDRSVVNEAELRALGAMGVVKLGENNLQVIIGTQAESIATRMKSVK